MHARFSSIANFLMIIVSNFDQPILEKFELLSDVKSTKGNVLKIITLGITVLFGFLDKKFPFLIFVF